VISPRTCSQNTGAGVDKVFAHFLDTISRTFDMISVPHQRLLLDVQVAHFQGVLFDELAPGFDFVTHEDSEHVVGGAGVVHGDL